jgi:adenylate cyclase
MSETRKLAAILVSDVVAYSRLAGADEDRTLARLRTLRSDVIDPIISVHRGRVVKRTGDGAIVEFRSAVDAVRCAIEVQNAMVERNAEAPEDRRIVFRIGVHIGDVVEETDGDLMGDGVNIAARLQGIAQPGAICLSEDAYRQVKSRLDLKVSDLGAIPLKNIAEPMHVYSVQVGVPAPAKPATPAEPSLHAKPPAPRRRSMPLLLAAGTAALLMLVAGVGWWFTGSNRTTPAGANAPPPLAAQRLSIVVLPFANLSSDPAQDYLADSLTDELTTALARIRDGFVIARNTAFTYKGKPVDVKAIGKDLGVRYVLEGSVLPAGNQVRVNAQLIDADSGAHLWAEQFDTPRADLLQMQDEIVTHLAHAMDIQLSEAEAARLRRTPTANLDAEDLALRCEAGVKKGGYVGKEADAGSRLCEQALAADPNNVRALTWLAIKTFFSFGPTREGADPNALGDGLVSRALTLDPNYARAHSLKGGILAFQKGRLDESIAEYELALSLDPAMVNALGGVGWDFIYLGQFEKSLENLDKAIRLSPHDPNVTSWYQGKAAGHFGLKQYDQAIEWARRAIASSPGANPWMHLSLIAALALAGHEAEARDALQSYVASVPNGPKTGAALKAFFASSISTHSSPRYVETFDRLYEGMRKAGMPEGEKKTD